MHLLRYFIFISLTVIAQFTNHAMHKQKLQKAPQLATPSSYYKKHLAWWGHTTSICFFRAIRLIICGPQYGSNKLTKDEDAPYNIPTIESNVDKWTTKNIKILEQSLTKLHRLT